MKRVTLGIVVALLALLMAIQPGMAGVIWDGGETIEPTTESSTEGTVTEIPTTPSSNTPSSDPSPQQPSQPTTPGIYEGVTKVERVSLTHWDFYFSYSTCQYMGGLLALGGVGTLSLWVATFVETASVAVNPVIIPVLVGAGALVWMLSGYYHSGVIIKVFWLLPWRPIVYSIVSQR